MKVKDLLSAEQREKIESIHRKQLKPIRLNEKLSTNEWENIMGVHRDVYTRRNGAVRRK